MNAFGGKAGPASPPRRADPKSDGKHGGGGLGDALKQENERLF
ncbi:MAG: hypothetical protein ACM3QX_02970 [Syntrophomonadaceae bacterium]